MARKKKAALSSATGQLPLSEQEKQEISQELAVVCGEIEDVESEAKEQAKGFREQLEPLRERRTRLARTIRQGYREQDPQLNLPDT